MKRVIDFQISDSDTPSSRIIRVEYQSKFKSLEEIKNVGFPDAFDVMKEAESALKKQIGHDNYNIEYWYWIE